MAALMFFASLAGCGGSEKRQRVLQTRPMEEQGKGRELLTIGMFCAPASYQGVQTGWFPERRSRTPATWRSQHHSAQRGGGGDSLYQTRSATGNLGDLIVIRKDQLEDCY